MYNLLITSEEGAWDKESYIYDISRFLEYTHEDIASKFKFGSSLSLDERFISSIKSYPCLFVYERGMGVARMGSINDITRVSRRRIKIDFSIYKNSPELSYIDLDMLGNDLDIRKWEINRTHWAIKDIDLYNVLYGYIDHNIPFGDDNVDEEVDLPEQKEHVIVHSVVEFIEKISVFNELRRESEIFYRGHSCAGKYMLAPSLFRKDEEGNYLYKDREDVIYRELMVSNSGDFRHDHYTLDSLVRMQHYSLPTRLLDITSNPLIALYFACTSNLNEVGEVIIFTMDKERIKYFDSDVVSCLANLSRLSSHSKKAIDFSFSELSEFNDQDSIKKLVHFVKEEKGYFEAKINSIDLQKIVCVKVKRSNDRISSQSGAFLLFGHEVIFDEDGNEEIDINRIRIVNKASVLQELDFLNINESTVFPYIENSAKYVASKYRFEN
ncbi:hypothetical protein C8233_15930 [Halomonas sp. SF2003]|nr:hypothetical protein C8233_15930 [Halomonas sp. SF2003]